MQVKGLALCLLATVWLGCDKSRDEKASATSAPSKPQAPASVFTCLKVSGGPGVGRACMGPGYAPGGTTDEDVFGVDQAWCLTRRVSWTNRNSVMRCAVSKEDCEQDLMTTPAGKRNIMIRTACVLTTPERWTYKEQTYSVPDGFTCNAKMGNLCSAFLAEMLPDDEEVLREAWCSEGPEKGQMFNLSCYRNQEDCEKRRFGSKGPCVLRDANWAVDQEYGGLDKG